MDANDSNRKSKLIYPELSYKITGICFEVHNILGRYCREKQYCDLLEKKFNEYNIANIREYIVKGKGNRVDFLIEEKIILEAKAKKFVLKDDYYQIQRYLQSLKKKLGSLVNFRNRYLKLKRIIRIDTDVKKKFI